MKNEDITNAKLLEAVSKGFTAVEQRFQKIEDRLDGMATKEDLSAGLDGLEQRLTVKIDGVRKSLDAEILRRTDEYAQIIKRLTTLEQLHGIDSTKKEPVIA